MTNHYRSFNKHSTPPSSLNLSSNSTTQLSSRCWAFIRAHNEITTIEASLNSLIPALDRGIIGYHSCTDGSEEVILRFCQQHPNFIPFKYPFDVIPHSNMRYLGDDYQIEQRLDYYYNAVLDHIPTGDWLIKIDCDHIYDTEKLSALLTLPKSDDEIILFPKFNLHYMDGKFYLLKDSLLQFENDHFLIKKTENLHFIFKSGHFLHPKIKLPVFYAWEKLADSTPRIDIITDACNWHFPYMKQQRSCFVDELLPIERYHEILDDDIARYVATDMFNPERLREITGWGT